MYSSQMSGPKALGAFRISLLRWQELTKSRRYSKKLRDEAGERAARKTLPLDAVDICF